MIDWLVRFFAWIISMVIGIVIGAVLGYAISILIFLLGRGLAAEYPRQPNLKIIMQTVLYIGCGWLLLAFGGYSFLIGFIVGCFSFMNGWFFDVRPLLLKKE
jgi:hypothetical protein